MRPFWHWDSNFVMPKWRRFDALVNWVFLSTFNSSVSVWFSFQLEYSRCFTGERSSRDDAVAEAPRVVSWKRRLLRSAKTLRRFSVGLHRSHSICGTLPRTFQVRYYFYCNLLKQLNKKRNYISYHLLPSVPFDAKPIGAIMKRGSRHLDVTYAIDTLPSFRPLTFRL